MRYIKWFKDIRQTDVPLVGGKTAALGEMMHGLTSHGITIPNGFSITADAYWHYIQQNNFLGSMKSILAELKNPHNAQQLKKVGKKIRQLLASGHMPEDLEKEIIQAYTVLSQQYKQAACDVAVRSSATAEDLPTASFAGQQESFLNIHGPQELIDACKKCIASLFTDRAIVYRIDKKFNHFKVALSIAVQKMVRSDLASSGVAFSLDPETGFKDVVVIDASYGLGEAIVQGWVTPDEFVVHKPTLQQGFRSIIQKKLGEKKIKIIYSSQKNKLSTHNVKKVSVAKKDYYHFALTDDEVLNLAHMVMTIEEYYSKKNKRWMPMDVEWAKDGQENKLYIVQARPETVHGTANQNILKQYSLKEEQKKIMLTGLSIGQQIATGVARIIQSAAHIEQVQPGDIIVTSMTDPDWVPAMKKAAGIITDRGGRTCHAAIVSRELGIPAIVGTDNATKKIKTGQRITLDCSQGTQGFVYEGMAKFTVKDITLKNIPKPPVPIMINIADPNSAFTLSFLPVSGVGLARIEFIISNVIKIHPLALLYPKKITDKNISKKINTITAAYTHKPNFFVDQLAYGIATIAAAFYPRPVIVRFSDFKTNEYRNLIGGQYFEPEEENPMLGLRGASRYYHPLYEAGFLLECAAFIKVRKIMGLKNVKIMVPFVRTVTEAQKVVSIMKKHGLRSGEDDLEIVMMCEIPSNVVLIDEFSTYFDGFSIGSNDLTQLTLGVDRDSEILAPLFDERDPAVRMMMALAIEGARRNKKPIGICGQAPSDYPEVAQFLIEHNITTISLNPDSVLPFILRL